MAGKVAAITGASSGIGRATAERLAREGMDVALAARRQEDLEAVAERVEDQGTRALPVVCDVTAWDEVRAFASEVGETFGGVDLLFINAGRGGGDTIQEMDVDTWRSVLDTNLTGAFYTAKAFLGLMQGRPGTGTIALTASVAGTMGMAGGSAYCASKWGLRGFAQCLALEAAEHAIRVTSINPGYVNTSWHEGHPRAKEMIQPGDIADLVAYVAKMPGTAQLDDVTVWPAKMYDQ